MKIQKTLSEILFTDGNVQIEVSINYKTKQFSITHGSNYESVTYKSDGKNVVNDLKDAVVRNKCVSEALKYIKKELSI